MNSAFWIAGAVLILLILFLPKSILASLRKSRAAPPIRQRVAPELGRAESKSFSLVRWLLLFFVIAMVYQIDQLQTAQKAAVKHEFGTPFITPVAPKPDRRYVVTVTPGKETAIPIEIGMTCDTAPVNPNQPGQEDQTVWVRYEGSTQWFKDWKGRPAGGFNPRSGANYQYLRTVGSSPVQVEVHIYPTGN